MFLNSPSAIVAFSHCFCFSLSLQAASCKTSPSLLAIVSSPILAFHRGLEGFIPPPFNLLLFTSLCTPDPDSSYKATSHPWGQRFYFCSQVNSDLCICIAAGRASDICRYCHTEPGNFSFKILFKLFWIIISLLITFQPLREMSDICSDMEQILKQYLAVF